MPDIAIPVQRWMGGMRMADCEKCLHNDVCDIASHLIWDAIYKKECTDFKDSTKYVEVVRCKDCKYYDNREGICWCELNSKFFPGGLDWHSFPEDGFCSYGERKDND